MSFTFARRAGSPAGSNTITVTGGGNGSWTDSVGVAIASQPQTADIQTDSEGYVTSASVKFTGGGVLSSLGGAVGSSWYGKAPFNIDATGFRPYTQLVVQGAGPAGVETATVSSNSTGVYSQTGAGLVKFYGSNYQVGSTLPSASVSVREARTAVASAGSFPGDLWGALYYAVEGQFGGPRTRIPDIPVYRITGVGAWVPGSYIEPRSVYNAEHKAYAQTLYAGDTDSHTAITSETPTVETIMQNSVYDLAFNSYSRRYRRYLGRVSDGDAMFIRADATSVNVVLEISLEDSRTWSKHSGWMAYAISSDGTFLGLARRVSNTSWVASLNQGESLIISSVELGTRGRHLDWVYPWGQSPEGSGVSTDDDIWYPIPTRSKVYRTTSSGSIASTFIKPGTGRMTVKVS